MKITVVGHFCIDIFHHADGSEEKQPGGIFHSVAALANLASDRDMIMPVFGIGETEYEEVKSALSQYRNIDLSGIFQFAGGSNNVHYYADGSGERTLNISKPIPLSHIKNFLNVDGVIINMISGQDITVDTIDEIRLVVRGEKVPIHLDIHSLTLTVNKDGTRTRKPMADWRRWCFMTDSVQMNEEEAKGMSVEHFNDELLAKQMIPLMVKAFVITRGEKGSTVYQEDHKHLYTTEITNDLNPEPVSTIGSGDIFGSSFFYHYLKKNNYIDAAKFAQSATAHSTKFPLSEKHKQLKAMRDLI